MDKESSSGQSERAIDSSRHALKGDVFRISRLHHQLVIHGTRRGRSWSKPAKIYVSEMVFDSYDDDDDDGSVLLSAIPFDIIVCDRREEFV